MKYVIHDRHDRHDAIDEQRLTPASHLKGDPLWWEEQGHYSSLAVLIIGALLL